MSILLTILGVALVVIAGPIGILTPFIPVGLPIAIVGLILIGRNSRLGKWAIVRVSQWHPRVRNLYVKRLRPLLATRKR